VAAWAGVHGGDQLEARGELGAACGTRDRDGAGLEGFAQGFEGGTGELGLGTFSVPSNVECGKPREGRVSLRIFGLLIGCVFVVDNL
jgi:hypothetical protein